MIRNVVAVYRLRCNLVPDTSVASVEDIGGFFAQHGVRLDIQVPARLSVTSKVVDKNLVWDYQLVFRTCQRLEVRGHYAYRLDLADGLHLLIGSCSRPFPVTVSALTLPDNMSDSQLQEVTVTWSVGHQAPDYA